VAATPAVGEQEVHHLALEPEPDVLVEEQPVDQVVKVRSTIRPRGAAGATPATSRGPARPRRRRIERRGEGGAVIGRGYRPPRAGDS
jgi:hypothetical protein